jgi:hypothetical protein
MWEGQYNISYSIILECDMVFSGKYLQTFREV